MKRSFVHCVLMIVVLLALAASAPVQAREDHFDALIAPDGTVTGGGSGYNEGHWYHYSNFGWDNQWFYDDPLDLNRRKTIDYSMEAVAEPQSDESFLLVAINWTSWLYPSGTGQPPLPPLSSMDENHWIEREVVFMGAVSSEPVAIFGHIDIPYYNPEWVSIDIAGQGVRITNGRITHECLPVPEPGTLALLALGGLALVRRRK